MTHYLTVVEKGASRRIVGQVLGPSDDVEPGPDFSPVSLARMKAGGAIVKGKPTASGGSAPGPQ